MTLQTTDSRNQSNMTVCGRQIPSTEEPQLGMMSADDDISRQDQVNMSQLINHCLVLNLQVDMMHVHSRWWGRNSLHAQKTLLCWNNQVKFGQPDSSKVTFSTMQLWSPNILSFLRTKKYQMLLWSRLNYCGRLWRAEAWQETLVQMQIRLHAFVQESQIISQTKTITGSSCMKNVWQRQEGQRQRSLRQFTDFTTMLEEKQTEATVMVPLCKSIVKRSL